MADTRVNPEAPVSPTHTEIRREDYRPPDFLVPEVELDFTLDAGQTRVRSRLTVTRSGNHDRPLRLAGDELTAEAVRVDGQPADYQMDGSDLVIAIPGETATVETEVTISPEANSKLMGLYASGGILCTQCEAEGFRRITFHPDRPDVMSVYRVRMSADKARYPILLANGNPVASGDNDDGSHWAEWHDPFPKPSYLFALVAGDLAANRDHFTTMSGRKVDLAIWVREADLPKTAHAMESLKQSMRWDEEYYGREYDLDLFNIVAVADFNFGAMENKGLNIFNSRYILADVETATDTDFDNVAGVVAHEYFHNWSGNRVTCRDWFQLSLKEGFTVFRDQTFSADIGSEPVKRIEDVRLLRAVQFVEDAGPLAHSVRPDSYMEIANFYTATVYNKGAELIRMMRTILGPEKYRAACDLYFERHDGEAATCDDFVACMEEAGGIDLSQFKRWYSQAGTPKVEARLERDGDDAVLHLKQSVPPTPGQDDKQPMVIPLRTALVDPDGGEAGEQLILLTDSEQSERFEGAGEGALLSINRGFSAPVEMTVARGEGELEALATADPDPFARYEALQDLMMRALVAGAKGENPDPQPIIEAMRSTLVFNSLDPAFKGEALMLPSDSMIAQRFERADPEAIFQSRRSLAHAVGEALANELSESQQRTAPGDDLSNEAKGIRRLRSVALGLLSAGDRSRGTKVAYAQYESADNMTDRQGALAVLSVSDEAERAQAFADFYDRYQDDSLVIDKWFMLQAMAPRDGALDDVEALLAHEKFTLKNPNRLRSLAGGLASNHWQFHHPSGLGYDLLAKLIVDSDAVNPQVAARLVPPLGRWRRIEEARALLMRTALERVLRSPGLSKDVYEQASKSLG